MSDVDPKGQALETPDLGQGDLGPGNGQVEEKPFHTYEDQVFKTPDDLNKFIKDGTFMRKDYTQKTQSLGDERRRYENERADWLRKQTEWDDKIKLYKQVDELFKANPQAFKTVQQMLRQGASGSDVQELINKAIEEKVGPKLSEFENYQKMEQVKQERNRHFETLKSQYPDLDEKAIQAEWDRLMAPESHMGTLMELIYHALKGKGINPAQIQKETIDNLEKKSKAGIPTTKGANFAGDKKTKAKNMHELTEELIARAGD
jgi:hypothetical protein